MLIVRCLWVKTVLVNCPQKQYENEKKLDRVRSTNGYCKIHLLHAAIVVQFEAVETRARRANLVQSEFSVQKANKNIFSQITAIKLFMNESSNRFLYFSMTQKTVRTEFTMRNKTNFAGLHSEGGCACYSGNRCGGAAPC